MPDRLPPSWGREPEDGRDLDALLSAEAPLSVEALLADEALLSGQMTGISESQRPVAGAMFALRAAPVQSEFAGEAAARAAFRALIEPAGTHRTLVLPVPAAGQDQGLHPPARHRHRKRAAGRGWQVVAMIGSAAAAVAIGVAALAGTFSGSAGQRGHPGSSSAVQMSTPDGGSVSAPAVLGHATKDPTPSATPKASATPSEIPNQKGASSRGSALCGEYFRFDHRPDSATRKTIFHELSRLAGTDSPWGVFHYCTEQQDQHLFTMPPEPTSSAGSWPWFPGASGAPASGGGNGGPGTGAGANQAGLGQDSFLPGGSGSESSGMSPRGSR
jgi:hypothetical protein